MRVWRLCRRPHAATPLDGLGGLHASGRWHHRGHRVVYAASSPSLAALEVLVHVDPRLAPSDLRLIGIEIADTVTVEEWPLSSLPRGWDKVPAPASTMTRGTAWLGSGRTAVLVVPSAVVPMEKNVLLNPQHPDIADVRLVSNVAFQFDQRLL